MKRLTKKSFFCSTTLKMPSSIILRNILGKGKGGEVYEGSFTDPRDNSVHDPVAIKVVTSKDKSSFEKQREEVKIVQKLFLSSKDEDIPVVKVLANVEEDNKLFIIMEKYDGDGVSFEKQIQDLKKDEKWDEVLRLLSVNLLNLCRGLKKFFKSGLIHRDIKPANFLFNKNSLNIRKYYI